MVFHSCARLAACALIPTPMAAAVVEVMNVRRFISGSSRFPVIAEVSEVRS